MFVERLAERLRDGIDQFLHDGRGSTRFSWERALKAAGTVVSTVIVSFVALHFLNPLLELPIGHLLIISSIGVIVAGWIEGSSFGVRGR